MKNSHVLKYFQKCEALSKYRLKSGSTARNWDPLPSYDLRIDITNR